MKTGLLSLLTLTGLLNSNGPDTLNVIEIVKPAEFTINRLSEIASDINYIPLETNENSSIERIITLRINDKYIYVGTLNSIVCFNSSGKFLFTLSKKGRGNDEYEFFLDFDINAYNSIIAIPCRKSIILYNQTDNGFDFLKRINISYPISKIDFIGDSDNILLQFGNSDGEIPYSKQLINTSGDILMSWPNYMMFKKNTEKIQIGYMFENASFKFQNQLFLKSIGNDTIFKLKPENIIEPFLVLDTKNKRLTPEVRSDPQFHVDHLNEFIVMQKIFGSSRFLYYTYEYLDSKKHEIFDLLKKIRYRIPENEFLKDDISGGANFKPEYSSDGILYGWIEPLKMKEFISDSSWQNLSVINEPKKTLLKTITDTLKDNDNPVLIMVKIK